MGKEKVDNSAQMAQIQANREAQEYIRQATNVARSDTARLFPQALGAQRGGNQAALDLYGQSMPQQMQQLRRGNTNAQQVLLNQQGGIESALMGNIMPQQQMNPTRVPYDPTMFTGLQLPPTPELGAIPGAGEIGAPIAPRGWNPNVPYMPAADYIQGGSPGNQPALQNEGGDDGQDT